MQKCICKHFVEHFCTAKMFSKMYVKMYFCKARQELEHFAIQNAPIMLLKENCVCILFAFFFTLANQASHLLLTFWFYKNMIFDLVLFLSCAFCTDVLHFASQNADTNKTLRFWLHFCKAKTAKTVHFASKIYAKCTLNIFAQQK